MAEVATPGRLHDLGNLMLAFIMLWAYMSFSQFLIIWSGNLTEEIPWYLRRTRGGWQWVALALIVFHFFLPFFVLLFRENKRQSPLLAGWRALDPGRCTGSTWSGWSSRRRPTRPARVIPWGELPLSVAAIVGIGGVWAAFFIGWLKRRPLVPLHDPSLIEALEHAGG